MNRLHHLQQTLLKNIEDNQDYNELEFIVLNYNSQDDMELWVQENLGEYIANGKVTYYKTFEPSSFSHSHAKNLAFKLANGDILCNINADHFTGPGFANYINKQFNRDENIVLTPIDFYRTKKNYNPISDVLGRVCIKKSDFLKVKGFDEGMTAYGFEDYDFVNRLEIVCTKRVLIEDFTFLQFIPHEDEERYSSGKLVNNVHDIFVNYSSPSSSDVIFLYKDGSFDRKTLINNLTAEADNCQYAYKKRNYFFEISVKDLQCIKGKWRHDEVQDTIICKPESGSEFLLHKSILNEHKVLLDPIKQETFYSVAETKAFNFLAIFNIFLFNRVQMERNLKDKRIEGNPAAFGAATVYKNFDLKAPLHI